MKLTVNQQKIIDLLFAEYDDYLFLFEFGFDNNIKQELKEVRKELDTLVEMGLVRRSASILNDYEYTELEEDDDGFFQFSELSEQLGETNVDGWTTTYTLDDSYAEECDF